MANMATNPSEHAARDAWEAFLNKHPRVQGLLSIVSSCCGYFLNGHAIVALVQWMVRVAGRVAESALLLATLYVTLNNVAHTLVTWVLPASAISALNYLSLVAFSLLPELIVAAAIKTTVDHWAMLVRRPTWGNPAWVWAVLYSLPTTTFVVMTIVTLSSFVQVVATSGDPLQATGIALTVRLFAGWSYAMIEILFATIGKKSYAEMLDGLRAMVATQGEELSILRATVQGLTSERDSHQQRATIATQELRIARESIARVQEEKATMQQALEQATREQATLMQDIERLQTQLRIARARATARRSALATPTTVAPPRSPEQAMDSGLRATEDSPRTGYVAIDDGEI